MSEVRFEGMSGPCSRTDVLRAIREQCIECMGGQIEEIRRCSSRGCSLYPFRFGKVKPNEVRSAASKARFNDPNSTFGKSEHRPV